MKTHQAILEAARHLNETHSLFKQSYSRLGSCSEETNLRLEAFHTAYASIGCFALMANDPKLQAGGIDLIESVIDFLEADPMCFHSGYIKGMICHSLKQAVSYLGNEQKERLQRVILHVAQQPGRQEFCHYARLARRIATPAFVKQIEALPETGRCTADHKTRLLATILQKPSMIPGLR